MRKMKISYLAIFLSGMMLSLLVGCSKDAETDSQVAGKGMVPIQVVMKGYQDMEDAVSGARSISEKSQVEVVRQDLDIPGYEDYEMVMTIEKTPINEIQTRGNLNNESVFNMFVFDAYGASIGNWQYKVNGTTTTLIGGTTEEGPQLEEGVYKFVSTTYNTGYFDENIADILVENGDDFATGHTTSLVTMENNIIPIYFTRQMSKFEVTATATGFTDNKVTIGSVMVVGLYTNGTITLSNSSTSNTSIVGTGYSAFVFDDNGGMVIPKTGEKTITLKDIIIEGKNRGSKEFKINTDFDKGRNYKIKVSFTKKNGFIVGGVEWATGGLQYANGVYSIIPAQDQFTGVNDATWNAAANPDYYSFYTLSPTSTSLNNGDPCSKVAPAGTWRLPTKADFDELIRAPYVFARNSNGVFGYFFDVTEAPVTAEEQASTLFFPAAGFRSAADNKFYTVKNAGYYWSSTSADASNAYYLLLNSNSVPAVPSGTRNAGLNIRCVKR